MKEHIHHSSSKKEDKELLFSTILHFQKDEGTGQFQLLDRVDLEPDKGVIFGTTFLSPKVIESDQLINEVDSAKDKGLLEGWAYISSLQRGLLLGLPAGIKVAALLTAEQTTNLGYIVDEESQTLICGVISTKRDEVETSLVNWQRLMPK